jgi:uncharacterized YccA/Bax inhibitor family protein
MSEKQNTLGEENTMRSSNPVLRDDAFSYGGVTTASMTVQGVINKTALLLLLVVASAAWVWNMFYSAPSVAAGAAAVTPWLWGGLIGGLVMALITAFKQSWAAITAPLYALLQGLVVGGLSALMEVQFPGIAVQAVGLTFGTLAVMLVAYSTGLIKVNDTFRTVVTAATGAIALVYLASLLLGFFGIQIPYIHESGLIGIGFSVFVTGIAALNLALDFDFVAQGVARRAPQQLEWYGAFGLIVTLIWLYIEFLRLLSKLRSRE